MRALTIVDRLSHTEFSEMLWGILDAVICTFISAACVSLYLSSSCLCKDEIAKKKQVMLLHVYTPKFRLLVDEAVLILPLLGIKLIYQREYEWDFLSLEILFVSFLVGLMVYCAIRRIGALFFSDCRLYSDYYSFARLLTSILSFQILALLYFVRSSFFAQSWSWFWFLYSLSWISILTLIKEICVQIDLQNRKKCQEIIGSIMVSGFPDLSEQAHESTLQRISSLENVTYPEVIEVISLLVQSKRQEAYQSIRVLYNRCPHKNFAFDSLIETAESAKIDRKPFESSFKRLSVVIDNAKVILDSLNSVDFEDKK